MTGTLARARPAVMWVAVAVVAILWALRDVALLVAYSVLLAYALLPIVHGLQRVRGPRGSRLPRGVAAGAVILALFAVAAWAIAFATPRLAAEAAHFVSSAPQVLARARQSLHDAAARGGVAGWLGPTLEGAGTSSSDLLRSAGGALAGGAARVFGGIGQLLGFALLPLLAFYLLADSGAVRASALSFFPEDARPGVLRLGEAVDRALGAYVRGQAIVCVVMGTVVGAALALMHHPAALLLGVLVGVSEVIPFLGPVVAAIAILLAGATVSLLQGILGVGAYALLNWIVGTFVTPRVMSRYLKMHPFVVTVSVLAGARLLGPAGALLALPCAAVIQTVMAEIAPATGEAAIRSS